MDKISFLTLALAKKYKNPKNWLGVTTTALTDGAETNPIMIDGEEVTATAGNVVQYGSDTFVFNGEIWQLVEADITVEGKKLIFN